MGDWERRMRECPHCHGPRDECEDAERVWHVHHSVCHKTADLRAAERIHAAEYEAEPWHDGTRLKWAKEQSNEFRFHYMDGASVWVAAEPQSATSNTASNEPGSTAE